MDEGFCRAWHESQIRFRLMLSSGTGPMKYGRDMSVEHGLHGMTGETPKVFKNVREGIFPKNFKFRGKSRIYSKTRKLGVDNKQQNHENSLMHDRTKGRHTCGIYLFHFSFPTTLSRCERNV